MILTGRDLIARNIILGGVHAKVDDGIEPSYGLDGMGYTFRGLFTTLNRFELMPGISFTVLTQETVNIPLDCGALLYIKSTYGRQGLLLTSNSPVDPGYKGLLTIRCFNSSNVPVMVYPTGGFMMLVVHQLTQEVLAYRGRWMK